MADESAEGAQDASNSRPRPADAVELSADNLLDAALADNLLDAALAEQRRHWVEGKRVSAAELLKAKPALASNAALAAELVYHEFLLRQEVGESPAWDAYLEQFPQYATQLLALRQADLILSETIGPPRPKGTEFGDYEILEEIGRGGIGFVCRAIQRSLSRVVAVKMLRNGAFSDSAELARFMKEATAVSRLNHPNIVHIYDVGETGGQPFISFEFVDGPSLAKRIDGTPLPARLAASIVATVARAVQYAHDQEIVHRDLKPANVLLSGPPNSVIAKVTDFGACKKIDERATAQLTQIVGTPSYMAPEQLGPELEPVGVRTDVYGLGAVLYECLTGRAPFRADSIGETLRQVVENEPVRPRMLNPALPRDIETICLKCLSKAPRERYDSADALADDLTRFLNREPIEARRPGPLRVAALWCRRNRALTALAFSLVIGISGIVYQWRVAVKAQQAAVASDAESLQLVSDLIQADSVVTTMGAYRDAPRVESLLIAESHCKELLETKPGDLGLRVALTRISGHLGTVFMNEGRIDEAAKTFRNAKDLWEQMALAPGSTSDSRDWLATTYSWSAFTQSFGGAVRFLLQTDAIWQMLAEEQPDNLDFVEKLQHVRHELMNYLTAKTAIGEMLRVLEEVKLALAKSCAVDSADRISRKRLALVCFLLGDAYQMMHSDGQAASNFQEAWNCCEMLHNAGRDEIPLNELTVIICSRLIRPESREPYYQQAAKWGEANDRRLSRAALEKRENVWLREAILETRCLQVLCHSKAGENNRAEQVCRDGIEAITRRLDALSSNPANVFQIVDSLAQAATLLRKSKAQPAALSVARQAATLASRFAAHPSQDASYLGSVAAMCTRNSMILERLRDFELSLQQAELSRESYAALLRRDPANSQHLLHLSSVWWLIGKARWGLNQRDAAIDAFQTTVAIQRRVLDRDPMNRSSKNAISASYDELVHWGGLKGDWATAARALLEREKLWRKDRQQLMEVSRDFQKLAGLMVDARRQLSEKEEADRKSYLAESERIRRDAEALKVVTENGDKLTTNVRQVRK